MSAFTDQMFENAATSTRGLVTGTPDDAVRRSWGDVHREARSIAGALANSGVGPGSAVAVLAGDAADVAPLAQAIWMRGASLTMLQQPTPRTDLATWLADTNRAATLVRAAVIVVGPPFAEAIAALTEAGQNVAAMADLRTGPAIEPLHPDEGTVAMYQLTSGSTGTPKAVEITHSNLLANSVGLVSALSVDNGADVMVSWLPLSHDMGMVGFLAHPMQLGIELVAVAPEQFLRRPALWPDLITRHRGTITAGPNFAYALLARTLECAEPDEYDLSSLRTAINGAEPIDPRDVRRLAHAGARFGLPRGAVTPAYGMAETTLGICFDTSSRVVNVDVISRRDLHEHGVATPGTGSDAREIVSVGVPMSGIEVRVMDERSRPQPPRRVGSIEVRGAAVSRGYLTARGLRPARATDGWLHTGDLGYLDDHSALYVCGRAKDVIVIAGKNIYPTDIERAACAVPGVRAGNAAAVRIEGPGGREGFAILAESAQAANTIEAERIRAEITRRVGQAVGCNPHTVLVLPPEMLPKTPSGKLQRRKTAELLGRLDADSTEYAARRAVGA